MVIDFGLEFFGGAFFANLTTAGTITTSFGIGLGNTLEALLGALLINKFANGRYAFGDPIDIFRFAIYGGVLAPMISATVGVATLSLGGLVTPGTLWDTWLTWWLGDLGGALILAPLILVWSNPYKLEFNFRKTLEIVASIVVLIVIGQLVFGDGQYPIDFIVFPVLLWVAFRYSVRATVTATFILSWIAVSYTLRGHGPFARSSINESLLLLQSFMATVTITKAIVAAVVTKSREIDRLKLEFVSVASHELRTPMAAIKGLVAMILEGHYGKLNEELERPLNNVALSTERLISLTNDLLDVSRLDSGKFKLRIINTSLQPIAKEIVENLIVIANKKQIELKIGDLTDRLVRADPDYLRRILQNLVGNAIKFTNHGSVTISSISLKDRVDLMVIDTGVGMSPVDQTKIFEKFQQINSSNRGRPAGTGLGLYISKELAKRMHGNLYLKNSEVGKGSTFVLSLPISKP